MCAGCYPTGDRDKALLENAAKIHHRMTEHARTVQLRLDSLEDSAHDVVMRDSLAVWRVALAAWEQDLLEVPGYEGEHGAKEEGHSHHQPDPGISVEEMLRYQAEMERQLEHIRNRIK